MSDCEGVLDVIMNVMNGERRVMNVSGISEKIVMSNWIGLEGGLVN